MGRRREPVKTVTLTAPSGARVTVAEATAETYKKLGYKGAPGRPKAAPKDVEKPSEK